MGKVINITNKLNNGPTFIVVGENKQYKVDDNYKTLMKVSSLLEENGTESMMEAIELIIGKAARKEIENMSMSDVKVVFTALMAAVQGIDYEEAEARFQL